MKVLVAGGGVAGSACAVALARIGAEVSVIEAHNDPGGQVGSFLSLAANGLRALDVLGCLPQIQSAGFAVPRQRMWSSHGKLLGDVPRARRSGDPLNSVTLMRGDLVAALRSEAARSGARIVTGQRLTADHLRTAREDGTDLIVGADGIWSATRRALDPAAPEPAYAGLYSVSGVSEGMGLEPGSWNMIYGRRGAFIYLPAPDGSTWWSAQVSSPEPPGSRAAGLSELAGLFRTEERAAAIIRAASTVHGLTLHHVLGPVPRWHGDRMVLIGDAAHPVGSGQGASMAIEDAVVLAQQLRQNGTVPAALGAYDRLRRQRVAKMVKTASANHDAKTAGPIAGRLRNVFMPVFFGRFYERATAWLYSYDPGSLAPSAGAPAETHAP
jgi:2-polyprenyl-6-methoxyphenol hydroxylase-like FAD-dependent oxidoreductase